MTNWRRICTRHVLFLEACINNNTCGISRERISENCSRIGARRQIRRKHRDNGVWSAVSGILNRTVSSHPHVRGAFLFSSLSFLFPCGLLVWYSSALPFPFKPRRISVLNLFAEYQQREEDKWNSLHVYKYR